MECGELSPHSISYTLCPIPADPCRLARQVKEFVRLDRDGRKGLDPCRLAGR
jgi:hypothetical protein